MKSANCITSKTTQKTYQNAEKKLISGIYNFNRFSNFFSASGNQETFPIFETIKNNHLVQLRQKTDNFEKKAHLSKTP